MNRHYHMSLFQFLSELDNSICVYVMKHIGVDGGTFVNMALLVSKKYGLLYKTIVQILHSSVPQNIL